MPKIERFDILLDIPPEVAAQRLKAATRFRLMPHQGSLFGGRRPLGGRVGPHSFSVALDRRDWLNRSAAVARGRIEDTGGRTRIVGEAGLPLWLTWYLRVAVVLIGLLPVGALALISAPQMEPSLAVGMTLYLVFVGLASMAGVGWHVSHADSQVRELVDTLTRTVTAGPPQGEREPPEAAATAARASARRQTE